MVQSSHRIARRSHQIQIRYSPGLIERDPHDDARMTPVARDDLRPFPKHSIDRAVSEPICTRHLLPYQQPKDVGPIKVAGIFDLLMLAYAVEAHLLGQFHVPS